MIEHNVGCIPGYVNIIWICQSMKVIIWRSLYECQYMYADIMNVSTQECQYMIYESQYVNVTRWIILMLSCCVYPFWPFGNVWLSTFTKRGRLSFRRKIPRQTFFGESFIRMGSKSWKRKCHKNKEDPCTLKTADPSHSVYSPVHGFV